MVRRGKIYCWQNTSLATLNKLYVSTNKRLKTLPNILRGVALQCIECLKLRLEWQNSSARSSQTEKLTLYTSEIGPEASLRQTNTTLHASLQSSRTWMSAPPHTHTLRVTRDLSWNKVWCPLPVVVKSWTWGQLERGTIETTASTLPAVFFWSWCLKSLHSWLLDGRSRSWWSKGLKNQKHSYVRLSILWPRLPPSWAITPSPILAYLPYPSPSYTLRIYPIHLRQSPPPTNAVYRPPPLFTSAIVPPTCFCFPLGHYPRPLPLQRVARTTRSRFRQVSATGTSFKNSVDEEQCSLTLQVYKELNIETLVWTFLRVAHQQSPNGNVAWWKVRQMSRLFAAAEKCCWSCCRSLKLTGTWNCFRETWEIKVGR